MIISAVFSKPTKDCERLLGKPYVKIRMWKNPSSGLMNKSCYEAEFFTSKQSFRKKLSDEEFNSFLSSFTGKAFKSVVQQTEDEEIVVMTNRHGESKEIRHPKNNQGAAVRTGDRKKNYILQEGTPIQFLINLGVMTKEGKVVSQKYDKFRQINRFLEFIRDIVPDLKKSVSKDEGIDLENPFTPERPLQIVDFGCGKSYLTFAVYHYLTEIEKMNVEIVGLDLKADIIRQCSDFARELDYSGLAFQVGDAADFNGDKKPDLVISLHACDTATDYALDYAMKNGARAILSVPCCQHEINLQLEKKHDMKNDGPFSAILRFGLLSERLSSIATDALRAEMLEKNGYSVQVLEFIDMEHTPKNILIRALKKSVKNEKLESEAEIRLNALIGELNVTQKLIELSEKK